MKQEFTEGELPELEKQLSCPNGEIGIEVGNNMNETNAGMILNSIDFLELNNGNSVLELGPGNCGHLGKLLDSVQRINYFGLEISETMLSEAKKNNAAKEAEFKLYDGETIPYKDSTFDRIFSVNCIYFWSNPEKLMKEIGRTLKTNGFCVLTYVHKDFAKNLPFVGDKFTLYDQADITNLAKKTDLEIVEIKELMEQVKSKTAQSVTRKYAMAKLKRL